MAMLCPNPRIQARLTVHRPVPEGPAHVCNTRSRSRRTSPGWNAHFAAGLVLVPFATRLFRRATKKDTIKAFRLISLMSVANPHLVTSTWYDKVGSPEKDGGEQLPAAQPGLHLLQGHRDSFKYFLQHLFGFELRKVALNIRLTEDSTVFISESEADLKTIPKPRPSVPNVVGTSISTVLPAVFQGQRFSTNLMTERIYFIQGAEAANVVEMKGGTYLATAFAPMQLTDCRTGLTFTVQLKIGSFPMLTEAASLVISGNPYVIAHRLERSPGAYFSIDAMTADATPVHLLELCTEEYSRIRCRCHVAKGEDQLTLEVLMPKSNTPLPACLVLLALGLKPAQIEKARNANRIWTEEYDSFKDASAHDASWKAAEQLCNILNLSTDNFGGDPVAAFSFKTSWSFQSRVGPLGRRRLNERLNLDLAEEQLTPKDFLATMDLLVDSFLGRTSLQVDDIDSLVNKRLRSVGQKMQGLVRDWLQMVQEKAGCIPIKVNAAHGTGFVDVGRYGARSLDAFSVAMLWKENNRQMFDAVNPLSEVVQARRITQVSELGLDKIKRIQGIRLIHPSHYGRICPIETGEGTSAGIVMLMASNTRLTFDGEMQAPHQAVSQGARLLQQPWQYLLAQDQSACRVAQFDVAHAKDGTLLAPARPERGRQTASVTANMWGSPESVTMTHLGLFGSCSPSQVEYIACGAPISVAVGLIPFVEHDDANRALMGAKHQQQAVPTLWPERPVVGSGMEAQVATYSARSKFAGVDGHVLYSDAAKVITVSCTEISQADADLYKLRQSLFQFYEENRELDSWTNLDDFRELCRQLSCQDLEKLHSGLNSPEVSGRRIKRRLQDWYSSVGISPSCESGNTSQTLPEVPLPPDWIETEYCIRTEMVHHPMTDCAPTKKHTLTHDTVTVRPNEAVCAGDIVSEGQGIAGGELALGKNLVVAYMPYEGYNYEDAIVISERCVREDILTSVHIEEITHELCAGDVLTYRPCEGTWVQAGDPLIGLRRLSTAGWVDKLALNVPADIQGRVIHSEVQITESEKFGRFEKVQVASIMIAVVCRISVGDKLSGRHGNKGIVSKIVPDRDMPYLPDGTPVDVCLNPLGVPSRMNVGQIFENILGSAGRWNGEEYRVGSFDEMFAEEASRGLQPSDHCMQECCEFGELPLAVALSLLCIRFGL